MIASIRSLRDNRGLAQPFDPDVQSGSALLAATQWIEGALLGSFATAVAVIAVAWVGFAMLGGRASPRRAIQVVLGVFILIGAPMIARELAGLVQSTSGAKSIVGQSQQIQPPLPPPMPPDFDPYAGAAVPNASN